MPVLGYRATPAVHRVPDCDLEAHKAKIKDQNCSPGLLQPARNPCEMSEPGSEWTPSETVALIDAYIWMWLSDRAERTFVKAYLVRSLMAGPIAGRSKQSIEYKLRNVSKVFADLKLPHVEGYVPADNTSEDLREFVQVAFGRLASQLESGSPRMWG